MKKLLTAAACAAMMMSTPAMAQSVDCTDVANAADPACTGSFTRVFDANTGVWIFVATATLAAVLGATSSTDSTD